MVQSLATDKKGCIFSGTIFRILLNLVSCYGFKEGIFFFMTVKRRKQLQHYNSALHGKCCSNNNKKKNSTVFQHRHLTDYHISLMLISAESTKKYVTRVVYRSVFWMKSKISKLNKDYSLLVGLLHHLI